MKDHDRLNTLFLIRVLVKLKILLDIKVLKVFEIFAHSE